MKIIDTRPGDLAGTKVAIKSMTMTKEVDERLIDKECAVMRCLLNLLSGGHLLIFFTVHCNTPISFPF